MSMFTTATRTRVSCAALTEQVFTSFCAFHLRDAVVLHVRSEEFSPTEAAYVLALSLGISEVKVDQLPDVLLYDRSREWLVIVQSAEMSGVIDEQQHQRLKDLFRGSKAGLVFVTAFSTRAAMRSFLTQISWETEVWVADSPDHLIHFNGERFLGPYPDAMPRAAEGDL